MSTIAFDTESFNEAAQTLWNEARRRGYWEGQEATTSRLAQYYAVSMLEVARELLSGEPQQTRDIALARMVLGKTPLVHPAIERAIDRVKYNSLTGHQPTPQNGQEARDLIDEALEALR